ncbi:MAG: CusA/CzcA family heavy metal efflux RND transporter [Armatimonadetes bacterium]|nr:CusA/CzcA family heavy metal efflux RND transporter [Armatimonadota bacterium]
MINKIVDFSANNRFLIFLLTAAASVAGWWCLKTMPLDAIPDLSETQVIIYSKWDRSPDVVEDQVTYPIVTAMLGGPHVKTVRGLSDFGYSYVYVIFEEGTDMYWARSRVLEYLSAVQPKLPPDVRTELGPDATGLGWVYQYALVDTTGKHSLADLRSVQDWYLRYHIKSVPGVSEVAPIGGFGKQYQVNVDPARLQAYGIPISRVVEAVRGSNSEAGGRLLEFGGTEYMVRGRGYARSTKDIENTVLVAGDEGPAVRIRDVGQVVIGPDLRRGVSDLDGNGEAVSGIVVMRQGQNALDVIKRVKAKIAEVSPGLPAGVSVVPVYDRSELIEKAVDNLKSTLVETAFIVILIVFLFLWHFPSAIIPVITIPIALLISFIPFRLMGLSANIMSLGGLAIAVSALEDAATVVVEQTHKKLERWQREGRVGTARDVIIEAVKEVAGPSFYALLVIGVAFLPVLTLEAQEGRLFKPLAYTKTLSMVIAAILAITLDPAIRLSFMRMTPFIFRPRWLCWTANAVLVGQVRREEDHPISRFLMRLYEPVVHWSLRWKWLVFASAIAAMAVTAPIWNKLGSEFMPPLDEGTLMYMPSTMPGISLPEAQRVLQVTDRIIRRFPEVERVMGKAGRADTATDPAPLSMLETVITLKPMSEWRKVPTWYSAWAPEWLKPLLRHLTPDNIPQEQLVTEMNEALQLPGLSNAWTMPIKGRIDMLSTGIRTPVGLKVKGPDTAGIDRIGAQLERLLGPVRGCRSVFAERPGSGYYLDFVWRRDDLARYGLTVEEAQASVQNAIGGENVTTTVEGRERYPVNVRYMRDFRSDIGALARVLVATGDGRKQVPIGQLADIKVASGPTMIRDEDGMLTGYVYVDVAGRDPSSYVTEADKLVCSSVKLPPGYSISWSGQFEAMQRVAARLSVVVPFTCLLIFLLIFLSTRSVTKTLIVMLAVPFSAIGAMWMLYLLGYNMSVGVWVGLIALLGIDAETGVFMLLYLDLAYERAQAAGRLRSLAELHTVIVEGAVKRLRPKFMTMISCFVGLLPVMWSTGSGADVMKRIAAPVIGGILTSFLLELVVYPAIYEVWKWNFGLKRLRGAQEAAEG